MITNDSYDAEHFVAQCKRDLQQHPRRPLPQTYYGERLVNIGGVALVPESMAAELLSEVAL
jgi:delta 1-pyrroline-5-carboxylate dehydrogenase